jgi:hypothetical protein
MKSCGITPPPPHAYSPGYFHGFKRLIPSKGSEGARGVGNGFLSAIYFANFIYENGKIVEKHPDKND